MQTIMVIGDGMADRPLKELSYLTPLEAADVKIWVSFKGNFWFTRSHISGVSPGSDVANLAIFGYNSYKIYNGRGALEVKNYISNLSMKSVG